MTDRLAGAQVAQEDSQQASGSAGQHQSVLQSAADAGGRAQFR